MGTLRRTVLQQIVLTALGVGVLPDWLIRQGTRYGQALASSTCKVAVLLGINRYPDLGEGLSLQGCLTDLLLQKELLIHRFGFDPADILILEGPQVTPTQIRTALQDHLGGSFAPEAVVVHFSGHGCLLSSRSASSDLDSPIDSATPVKHPALLLYGEGAKTSVPLPVSELFQQIHDLKDPNVTLVLDCGFAYAEPGVRGNLRLRSRPELTSVSSPSSAELSYLEATGFPPFSAGALFAATTGQELAAEATWSGFTAGVLSYLLTQYLWETTPSTRAYSAFSQITSRREFGALACQHPVVAGEETKLQQGSPYFLSPPATAMLGTTGMVQDVKGNRAQVWLGGMPPAVLCGLQNGTVLAGVGEAVADLPPVAIRSRSGLYAQVASVENESSLLPEGTVVQERSRILSQSLRLVVGLDDSLDRIEKVDITSALAGLNWTETANPRERRVDCLLGRITPELAKSLQGWGSSVPVSGDAYGLFWSGREMVLNSFGSSGEAAGSAVQRLSSRMQHLLAAKRLRTLLNSGCSGLALAVNLSVDEGGDPFSPPVLRQQTALSSTDESLLFRSVGIAQFGAGQHLRLSLDNNGDRDLSVILLSLDGKGQLSLLSPTPSGGQVPLPLIVRSQNSLAIPPASDSNTSYRAFPDLFTCQPGGLTELLVLASTRSLQPTLDLIFAISREMGVTQPPILLNRPLDLAGMVLADLTRPTGDADLRQLNHQEVATVSMAYSVI